jgi:hypothetical protein
VYENRVAQPLEAVPLARVGVSKLVKDLGDEVEADGHSIHVEIMPVEGDRGWNLHTGQVYFLHGALSPG